MFCLYCGAPLSPYDSRFCCREHEQAFSAVGRFIPNQPHHHMPRAGFLVIPDVAIHHRHGRAYPHMPSRQPVRIELPRYPLGLPLDEHLGERTSPTLAEDTFSSGVQNPSGFPPDRPKGFPSEMPISQSQPCIRIDFGDLTMGGTLTTSKSRTQRPEPQSGPPNLHLRAARLAAWQKADERWDAMQIGGVSVEAAEFLPAVEWANICRLNFEVTGFDFLGDPEIRKPGKQVNDGPIVNVAKALSESGTESSSNSPRLTAIEWDQIEDTAEVADPAPLVDLSRLELYLPPAPAKKEKPEAKKEEPKPAPAPKSEPPKAAEVVLEAVVEEAYTPPPMAPAPTYLKPELRQPPAAPALTPAEPVALTGSKLQLPAISSAPLRTPLVAGPSPEPPAPPKPVEPPAPVAVVAEAAPVKVEPPKPEPVKVEPIKVEPVKVEPVKVEAPKPEPVKVEPPKVEPPKVESKPAPRAEATGGKKKKKKNNASRQTHIDDIVEEPEDLNDELEAELFQAPAEPVKAPEPVRREEPKPVAKETRPEPAPSISFGGMASAEVKAPKSDKPTGLGLSSEAELPPPAGSGMGLKLGIAAGVLAAIGGVAMFTMGGSSESKQPAAVTTPAKPVIETAGVVMGEAGWQTEYANDAAGKRIRQIAFYRPSLQVSDYRAEFEAEIDYKAVSWVMRANAKTHYVMKLYQDGGRVKLSRLLVKDNKPGESKDSALPFPTSPTMTFKVQSDAVGQKFRISVNNKLIDEWTDASMLAGGFGVANEGAERGQVRAIQLWHLRERAAAK